MNKRPVTLHLDEDVARDLERQGGDMSQVATDALREAFRLEAHRRALQAWLDELDDKYGSPTPEEHERAKQIYDEVFQENGTAAS